eukprot:6473490-Amphidinium_carterae.1
MRNLQPLGLCLQIRADALSCNSQTWSVEPLEARSQPRAPLPGVPQPAALHPQEELRPLLARELRSAPLAALGPPQPGAECEDRERERLPAAEAFVATVSTPI